MAYSTGILDKKVKFFGLSAPSDGDYGRVASTWTEVGEYWAAVDWSRGTRSLREGALEAYDTIMVRMRYTAAVDRNMRVQLDGVTYAIMSFHADPRENTIQITAQEIVE